MFFNKTFFSKNTTPQFVLKITIFFYLNLFVISEISKRDKHFNNCISPDEKEVDWFVIYILPRDKESKTLNYAYIDNNKKEFEIYDAIKNFPPIKIASGLNTKKSSFLIWNDDPKNEGTTNKKYDETYAHSKGLISFDDDNGLYITHSLPRFPFRNDEGFIFAELPENAGIYAQTFFCASISRENVEIILTALKDLDVNILLDFKKKINKNSNISKKFDDVLNRNGKPFSKEKSEIYKIQTKNGLDIDIFTKTKKYIILPWDGPIQENYKNNFLVETWTRPKLLPNICNRTKSTYNIIEMKIKEYIYKNTKDHSKWGVSKIGEVVCYGDLNRTESQKHRSGSVACFRDKLLAEIVRNFIVVFEKCSEKENKLQFLEDPEN